MGQVVTLNQLLPEVERLKAAGKTVVTTNGCFDLLHVGHLRYLQAARAQGDCLILALNSDASVQGLKGPTRPVVPETERAELLAALNCIDFVVLFDAPTPEATLEAIRPDVHAKGGQYTEATLPEAPLLKSMGTRMAFIEMVPGRSTSSLIERILAAYASDSGEKSASAC